MCNIQLLINNAIEAESFILFYLIPSSKMRILSWILLSSVVVFLFGFLIRGIILELWKQKKFSFEHTQKKIEFFLNMNFSERIYFLPTNREKNDDLFCFFFGAVAARGL